MKREWDKISADEAWTMRDEEQYQFLEKKYGDRRSLYEGAVHARKQADRSETIDGQPNPHHRRLVLEAEMAQMRYEMAYVIDKNKFLSQFIETIEFLHQRVGLVEGAYHHVKLLAETARIDYHAVAKGLTEIKKLKEQYNETATRPA